MEEDGIKEKKEDQAAEKKLTLDPFFAGEAKDTEDQEVAEKRVVQRDGYVPKLQKNIERIKKEKEEQQKRWE